MPFSESHAGLLGSAGERKRAEEVVFRNSVPLSVCRSVLVSFCFYRQDIDVTS